MVRKRRNLKRIRRSKKQPSSPLSDCPRAHTQGILRHEKRKNPPQPERSGECVYRLPVPFSKIRLFPGVLFFQISTNQFSNKSQNQASNHKHSCSQFGFWNLNIGTYLEIGSWKFPSLGARKSCTAQIIPGMPTPTLSSDIFLVPREKAVSLVPIFRKNTCPDS
jgi:hypothetical protein